MQPPSGALRAAARGVRAAERAERCVLSRVFRSAPRSRGSRGAFIRHPRTGTRPRRSTACSFPRPLDRASARGRASRSRIVRAVSPALGTHERRRRLDTSANEPRDLTPSPPTPLATRSPSRAPRTRVREAGFPGAGGAPPGGPPRPMMPTAGPPGVGAAGGPGPRGPAMGGPVPVASGPGQIQAQFQGQPQARPAGSAPNGFAPPDRADGAHGRRRLAQSRAPDRGAIGGRTTHRRAAVDGTTRRRPSPDDGARSADDGRRRTSSDAERASGPPRAGARRSARRR